MTHETAFLRLDTVRDHMDALEGTFLREHARAFATRTTPLLDRTDLHLRGLGLHLDETRAEAHRRCRSVLYSEAFTAAFVLARLAVSDVVSERGEVRFAVSEARNRLGVTTGIGASHPRLTPRVGDILSVEAASLQRPLPEGVLLAHLGLPDSRAGLLGALRHPTGSAWTMRTLENMVCVERGTTRALAVLALGRARARVLGRPDPAFASWLEHILGDDVLHPPVLVSCALIGHAATARSLQRRLERDGPSVDVIFALGLLGLPTSTATLVRFLESPDTDVAEESLRALYLLTGELFVEGDLRGLRDDGRFAVPDIAKASAFARTWTPNLNERHHLGAALTRGDALAAPSFAYLRTLATGASTTTAPTLLPGIVDDYPRRRGTLFDILPPAPNSEPRGARSLVKGRPA